jgi:hypothetical protein
MVVGPELDALVAEKVMNYRGGEDISWDLSQQPFRQTVQPLLYSTDIAAAWEVVDKVRARIPSQFAIGCEGYPLYWWARFVGPGLVPGMENYGWHEAQAPTAPLAICLAALKAVGVEV